MMGRSRQATSSPQQTIRTGGLRNMCGWLAIYVLYSSISVILRWLMDDNESLFEMEPRLWLERFPPNAGLEPGIARSEGLRVTYWATGARHFERHGSCRYHVTLKHRLTGMMLSSRTNCPPAVIKWNGHRSELINHMNLGKSEVN